MPTQLIDIIALGESPFQVLLLILQYGGLVVFFPVLVWMLWSSWKFWNMNVYNSKRKFVLLAIDVPKLNEQSMRAVELIIAALHGVHFNPNKKEKYWIGVSLDSFALEIVSIDGYIQYFVRCDHYNVELVKGAVYAQYPDAEIIEVEDYVPNVPGKFPDEEMDMWGTEFILAKPDFYPIRTYESFEHSLTGIYADPISAVLELLSRLKPGEQVWLQLIITPTGIEWRDQAMKGVDDIIGKEKSFSPTIGDRITNIPLQALEMAHDAVFSFEASDTNNNNSTDSKGEYGHFVDLTSGEKITVEEIQKKAARLHFHTKFRFIYLAKKDIINTYRVAGSVFGAIKQFNALDLNSLRAGGKTVTSGPAYLFMKRRREWRKNKLMMGYRNRSNWSGERPWVLSHVEIATIFHFPSELVRAPMVSKAESKKSEPPTRLPLDMIGGSILGREQEQPLEPTADRGDVTSDAPSGLHMDIRGDGEGGVEMQLGEGARSQPFSIPAPASDEVTASAPSRQYQGAAPIHSMPGLPPGVRPVDSVSQAHQSPRRPLPQEAPQKTPPQRQRQTPQPAVRPTEGPPPNLPM